MRKIVLLLGTAIGLMFSYSATAEVTEVDIENETLIACHIWEEGCLPDPIEPDVADEVDTSLAATSNGYYWSYNEDRICTIKDHGFVIESGVAEGSEPAKLAGYFWAN